MPKVKKEPKYMSNSEVLEELRWLVSFIQEEHKFRYHHLIDEIYNRLSYLPKRE